MTKREFKINFKTMLMWTLICMVLFLAAFLLYPTIVNSESAESLNDMLKAFPPELLKAFNMDISDINTMFGWFKTEGYTFLVLIITFYASLYGSTVLVKEESDRTIEFLYSKPVSKNQIITSKLLCALTYIILLVLLVTGFNYIGMELSGTFNHKIFWLLSLSPILVALPIFLLSLFVSTFFNKTKKTIGISIALVFVTYFIQMISLMGDKLDFFKYFTLFTLSDSRNIIENLKINPWCIIISLGVSLLFSALTYLRYNKKEFL